MKKKIIETGINFFVQSTSALVSGVVLNGCLAAYRAYQVKKLNEQEYEEYDEK